MLEQRKYDLRGIRVYFHGDFNIEFRRQAQMVGAKCSLTSSEADVVVVGMEDILQVAQLFINWRQDYIAKSIEAGQPRPDTPRIQKSSLRMEKMMKASRDDNKENVPPLRTSIEEALRNFQTYSFGPYTFEF